MPNLNSSGSVRDALNRCMPAAWDAKLGDLLAELLDEQNNAVIATTALAIKAGSSAVVKTTREFLVKINGTLLSKAAGDMSALVGTLATAKSAAWAFMIDSAGTITTATKTADSANAAAALALVQPAPDGKVLFGVIVIDNTSGSNFVGGTTALDAAGIAVSYFNLSGGRQSALATKDLESRY